MTAEVNVFSVFAKTLEEWKEQTSQWLRSSFAKTKVLAKRLAKIWV